MEVNNLYLYSNSQIFDTILLLHRGSFWFPMSVHWFFPWVSLAALLDPSIPSSLPSPATWWRTCAYVSVVSTGVSDSLPCVFILSHPPPSLMSQDLAYFLRPKQLCLPCVSDSLLPLLSFLCQILGCPCKRFFFFLFFALCSFPFLSAACQIPCSALALPAGWASLVGCAGGAGCVLLSCWWFSTMLKSL